MAGKNTAAFGIYPNNSAAERAVDQLIAAGFSNQDVSVLMADRETSKDFAAEKNTKAPEGATTGVGVGGAVGGALGLLAGIGSLAIPGVGPLIASDRRANQAKLPETSSAEGASEVPKTIRLND